MTLAALQTSTQPINYSLNQALIDGKKHFLLLKFCTKIVIQTCLLSGQFFEQGRTRGGAF